MWIKTATFTAKEPAAVIPHHASLSCNMCGMCSDTSGEYVSNMERTHSKAPLNTNEHCRIRDVCFNFIKKQNSESHKLRAETAVSWR